LGNRKATMILALMNNKGGVAKTTTAVNLAAALAGRSYHVLLIDLDNQGGASASLGVARTDRSPSLADVLLDNVPLRQVIRPMSLTGLDLVTGSMTLANVDIILGDVKGRERCLQQALMPVRSDYDFILLDCPPSLSLLPLNALVACDAFIVPITPHYLALEGLANLLEAIVRLKTGIGITPVLLGIVLTLVDSRAKATRDVIDRIRGQYGSLVFSTQIHVNVRLAEAPAFGQSIFTYDATATGAEAYRSLADEVLTRYQQALR